MSAESVRFRVTRFAFAIRIHFVGRDDDDALHAARMPSRLADVQRTDHIARIGFVRLAIRAANERLRCQVEDQIGPILTNNRFQFHNIANVAVDRFNRQF